MLPLSTPADTADPLRPGRGLERLVAATLALVVVAAPVSKAASNVGLGLAALGLLFLALRGGPSSAVLARRWRRLPWRKAWGAFYLGTALSWTGSFVLLSLAGEKVDWRVMTSLKSGLLFFVFYLGLDEDLRGLRKIFLGSLITASLAALLLVAQHGFGSERVFSDVRLFGTVHVLAGVNKLSACLATLVLLALLPLFRGRVDRREGAGLLLLTTPLVMALVILQSRTSQIAVLLGTSVLCAMRFGRRVALVALLVLGGLAVETNPRFGMRMITVDADKDLRYTFVKRAVKGIARRPILGHGLRVKADIIRRDPELDCYDGHNTLLTIWLRRGLVAAAAAAFLLFAHLAHLLRALRRSLREGGPDDLLLGLALSTLMAVLLSLTIGGWFTPSYNVYFFLTLALVSRHAAREGR